MNTNAQVRTRAIDVTFIITSILFNLFVSLLYIFVKGSNTELVEITGIAIIALTIPFTITTIGYIRKKAKKQIIVSHVFILFYFVIEIVMDYILVIPFREILILHIPYIIFFYAATFSMIGVSFRINRKMGFVVLATFLLLIACLVYMYA